MENKYYTPKLSELFVGYECEEKIYWEYDPYKGNLERWEKATIEKIPDDIEMHLIRTPFLTKEQILKEGWKEVVPYNNDLYFIMEKLKGFLHYNIKSRLLTISFEKAAGGVHSILCPSINEFRTILRLLNI